MAYLSLYDLASGKLTRLAPLPESGNYELAVSPSGQRIAVCQQVQAGFLVGIWDAVRGTLIASRTLNDSAETNLAFSADGKSLIVGKYILHLWTGIR
jgi:WD40 repeat protein